VTATSLARPVAEVAAGLGAVLGVWAHPDDEVYLSGGLMAAAVDAGARVVCVTATRGERGTSDPVLWPPARLARLREAELAASLAVLGVTEHRQLGYPDGGCAGVPTYEAVGRLVDLLAEVRPATVLTFGPDGMTGHLDHRRVSAWARSAVRQSEPESAPRLLYATKTDAWCDRFGSLHRALELFPPGLPPRAPAEQVAFDLVLPDDLLERKMAALRAHASQVAPLVDVVGEEGFRSWVANECFRPAAPANATARR
jgi:LmbE family N-acetylglucosaminyl deacetylase